MIFLILRDFPFAVGTVSSVDSQPLSHWCAGPVCLHAAVNVWRCSRFDISALLKPLRLLVSEKRVKSQPHRLITAAIMSENMNSALAVKSKKPCHSSHLQTRRRQLSWPALALPYISPLGSCGSCSRRHLSATPDCVSETPPSAAFTVAMLLPCPWVDPPPWSFALRLTVRITSLSAWRAPTKMISLPLIHHQSSTSGHWSPGTTFIRGQMAKNTPLMCWRDGNVLINNQVNFPPAHFLQIMRLLYLFLLLLLLFF